MTGAALPAAPQLAITLLAEIAGGRWQAACEAFDEAVSERLDADGLAAVWAQLGGAVGRFESMGPPTAYPMGDYTVVDIPLHFEAGELTGRVSYDSRAMVAGLYFLPEQSSARA